MKSLLFLSALFLAACSSWLPIAYQSAAALNADQVLYRDVHALMVGKAEAPASAYNPIAYGQIDGDILNCEGIYRAIAKSNLSIAQLTLLRHSIALYKNRDSVGASASFFQINGSLIDSTASAIVNLEQAKLTQ